MTLSRGILEDIGIKVQLALSTTASLDLTRVEGFDLVISNIARPGDISVPLKLCGAAYFAFPSANLHSAYDGDLNRFNAQMQLNPAAGFAMADKFAEEFPKRFGDPQKARIIFYAAASGGIAASRCARIITNRADILLQSVVSALEELRWEELLQSRPEKIKDTAR